MPRLSLFSRHRAAVPLPRQRRPWRSASSTKSWPSKLGPTMAMNKIALSRQSGCRLKRRWRQNRRRLGRRSPRRPGPWSTRPTVIRQPPSAASALRANSASSNGIVSAPTIWYVSWPLPAISKTCHQAARPRTASVIASARSPTSVASGQAARTLGANGRRILVARIVVGDDDFDRPVLRRSRPFAAAYPGSRSPPQPNTRCRRPSVCDSHRAQRRHQRVGRMGVVDIHRRAIVASGDFLQPTRNTSNAAERLNRGRRVFVAGDGKRQSAQQVLGLESHRPDQYRQWCVSPATLISSR